MTPPGFSAAALLLHLGSALTAEDLRERLDGLHPAASPEDHEPQPDPTDEAT